MPFIPSTGDQTTVTSGPNAGQVYRFDGTNWQQIGAPVPSNNWQLGGNTTTASNNILGTINDAPLRLYTNGM